MQKNVLPKSFNSQIMILLIICITPGLFQALGQWGRSKKKAGRQQAGFSICKKVAGGKYQVAGA